VKREAYAYAAIILFVIAMTAYGVIGSPAGALSNEITPPPSSTPTPTDTPRPTPVTPTPTPTPTPYTVYLPVMMR
jgi:hypothetical protein